MIVFTGLVACIFFTTLAGWSWPTNNNVNLTHAVLDAIGKSLWIAWLLVAVGYVGNIPGTALVWTAMAALLLAAIVLNRKRVIPTTRYEMMAIAAILAIVVVKAGVRFIYGIHNYARIFIEWDPLVSWNRWATELYANGYAPVAAAYPILFPGIWSLVYRAQGTAEIWFVAKLSLFIVPVALLLANLLLWKSGRKIAAVAMFVFAYWFFMRVQRHALFGGDMDSPVAMLMVIFAMLTVPLLDAIEHSRHSQAMSLLTTLAVFVGITAITKQAGFLCLGIFCILLGLLLYHKILTLKKTMLTLLVAATPYLTFYLVYSLAGQSGVVGNLSYLSGLTQSAAGEKDVVAYAFQMLSDRQGNLVISALCLVSLLNLRRIRDIRGQLGMVLFAASVAGFFIYADCCAYHARNGWWVISILAGSALIGVTGLTTVSQYERDRIAVANRPLSVILVLAFLLVCTVSLSAVVGIFINDQKARAIQEKEQWTLVPPGLSGLLKQTLDKMGPEDIIISPHQPIAWLPTMNGRNRMCSYNAPGCLKQQMTTAKTTYILVHSSTKELRIEDPKLLAKKYLIGSADNFLLYGPFKK